MTDLAQQHPAPDGTAPALQQREIEDLEVLVPDWNIVDGKLTREIQLKNFKEALSLVNRVGAVAEEENHHPDITIHGWNHVRLELYTHTVQGLSKNDFVMAARFDQLVPDRPQ